jgi:hypothetical protein
MLEEVIKYAREGKASTSSYVLYDTVSLSFLDSTYGRELVREERRFPGPNNNNHVRTG